MRPSFDQTEGFALSILDSLATGKRPHPFPKDRALEPSEELVRMAADRLAISMHRFLLAGGGARERTALRDGHRVTGRLWDETMNGGFRLHFTAATRDLWLGITHTMLRQKSVENIQQAPVEGTRNGDWLFYALAQQNLDRLAAVAPIDAPIQKRLRSGSPLVVLFTLVPTHPQRGSIDNHLRRLMHPSALRILECIDGPLEAAWESAIRGVLRRPGGVQPFIGGFSSAALVLEGYISCLDGAGRMDLTSPVMRLSGLFATRILEGSADHLRTEITSRLAPRTMQERSDAMAACARIAQLGQLLRDRRRTFAAVRYGEERWEEGQLYIAAYDEILEPTIARVDEVARALTGAIS